MVAQQLKQSVLNQTNPNTPNTTGNERSFDFDVSMSLPTGNNNSSSFQKQKMPGNEEKEDTFVTSKQYSENDVEMVQEILNDMIQKEENVGESSEELNLSGFDENLMVSGTESHQIKQETSEANSSSHNDNQNNSYSPNNSSSGSHSSMLNDSVSSGILAAENKLSIKYTDNHAEPRDK